MNEEGESSDGNSDCFSQFDPVATSTQIVSSDIDESKSISQSSVAAVAGSEESSDGDRCLKSMFKTPEDKPKRNVQFADDKHHALVTYQEPSNSQWNGVKIPTSSESIVDSYFTACSKAHTVVQDSICRQLREVRNNGDYSAILNLTDLAFDADLIDTLETVFQLVTFRVVFLDQCVSPYATDMFDMLEYYDPVKELVMTDIAREDNNMWHSVANAISSSEVLSSVSFREMLFGDNSLRILFEQGINGSSVNKMRFDACGLTRAPTFMLAHHLKNNEYLYELHLCYLDLYSKEAEILGRFLSLNKSLRILDLSNNKLGDHGLEVLSHGLFDQVTNDVGVAVLILFNNKLTKRCVDTLDSIIATCPLVHTINVGLNELTDIVLYETQESIENSRTLRALGLQSTLITCHGLVVLAQTCKKNKSLRHLNLRGNKAIQPDSLNALANIIHNTSLIQIDLDNNNKNCCNPLKYTELVNKVRQVVAVNKTKLEAKHPNEDQTWVQDQFLTCDSAYVPKSLMRATRSGYSHRFSVVPVSEKVGASSRSSASHRFTIVPTTSAAGGDFETSAVDAPDISKLNPTNIKSINVNAGGDTGSSASEGLDSINMNAGGDTGSLTSEGLSSINDHGIESPQSVSEENITVFRTIKEESSKELEDEEASQYSTSTDSSQIGVEDNPQISERELNSPIDPLSNPDSEAPIPENTDSVHTVDETPITVDSMDTTDDVIVGETDDSEGVGN